MKTIAIVLLAFLTASFTDLEQLNVGDKAPKTDLKMESVDGKKLPLPIWLKRTDCALFSLATRAHM